MKNLHWHCRAGRGQQKAVAALISGCQSRRQVSGKKYVLPLAGMQNKQTDRHTHSPRVPEGRAEWRRGELRRAERHAKSTTRTNCCRSAKDNNDSGNDNDNSSSNSNNGQQQQLGHGQDGSSVITQPIGLLSDFPISPLQLQLELCTEFSQFASIHLALHCKKTTQLTQLAQACSIRPLESPFSLTLLRCNYV